MTGLRERKKRETRQVIAETAIRLFAERGFEAVTVNEVAEAAGVAKVTLFKYFPSKESLVLHTLEGDDTAAVVAARGPGRSPVEVLRLHHRALAADAYGVDPEALITQMRVIFDSSVLSAGVNEIMYGRREALARALTGAEDCQDDLVATQMAAQISAALLTLQEIFFQRLVSGLPLPEAGRRLTEDVETTFDLLEKGFGDRYRR